MSVDRYKLQKEIFIFISEEIGTSISSLDLNTSLNYDLGIDGDDAIDFFDKFQKVFHISMNNFLDNDYKNYFGNEGVNPFNIFKLLKKSKKFTIRDLINVYMKQIRIKDTKV